jgi:hypothetical protein
VEQDDSCGVAPGAADAGDTFRRSTARPSVEAVEARQRLEVIIELFHDLDAALVGLGVQGDQAASQLSHQVRAEMIDRLLLDSPEQIPPSSLSPEQVAELRRLARRPTSDRDGAVSDRPHRRR